MRASLFRAVETLQRALSIPETHSISRSYDSWAAFAESRGLTSWLMEEDTAQEKTFEETQNDRLMMLSKVLTYPTTLACALADVGLDQRDAIRIHLLGARAEATLPPLFWQEVTKAHPALGAVEIFMVGPQVHPRMAAEERIQVDERLVLRFAKASYEEVDQEPPDLFFLCNSGIGDDKEGLLWETTLREKLLPSDVPAVLTSFDENDARQDRNVIQKIGCPIQNVKEVNPMRSLWADVDNGRNVYANYASFTTGFAGSGSG